MLDPGDEGVLVLDPGYEGVLDSGYEVAGKEG